MLECSVRTLKAACVCDCKCGPLRAACTDPLNRSDIRDTSQSFTSAHSCSARARCRVWLRLIRGNCSELGRQKMHTHTHRHTRLLHAEVSGKAGDLISPFLYCEPNKMWLGFKRNTRNSNPNNNPSSIGVCI